jgi:acyl-CoA thioesterase I
MIVQYYADSLGLPRPGIVELKQRYIYLFEAWVRENRTKELFIINRARTGCTIDKLFEVYKEDVSYIEEEKDVLIIHEGVCDCAPRPVSKKVRNIISRLPAFLKIRIISYLHKHRASLLKKGSVHYQVDKKEFRETLEQWLADATKKFKRIYLFNIAPTNNEIENHSPGFGKSIEDYNSIMKELVEAINDPRITIIDIYSLIIAKQNIDEYITKEDGHHITVVAHQLYADMLIEMESRVM